MKVNPQIIRFIEVFFGTPHFLFFGLTLTQTKRMVFQLVNRQRITTHVKHNDFLNNLFEIYPANTKQLALRVVTCHVANARRTGNCNRLKSNGRPVGIIGMSPNRQQFLIEW